MTAKKSLTIAIDAMGGDFGPEVTIPAADLALKQIENAKFLIFGDERKILPLLDQYPQLRACSDIHHTDKSIANDEKPSSALRSGKESSMRLAIDAVADGRADCVISGGNTGALMAMSKVVLRSLPGINRPAIASTFPTMKGETVMLDLGANIVCDAEALVQFALMGTVFARAVRNIEEPSVGLLNVGVEATKGHDEIRRAASILETVKFKGKYHGFIEGDDIPKGTVDVVVTDGFTGNVALKIAEGMGKMIHSFIKDSFKASLLSIIGGFIGISAFKRLKERIDPRSYNGGMFLGLNGICVKSHGSADSYAYSRAILEGAGLVQNKFNERVASEMRELINQESYLAAHEDQILSGA